MADLGTNDNVTQYFQDIVSSDMEKKFIEIIRECGCTDEALERMIAYVEGLDD